MGGNLSSQVARCIDVHQRRRRGRQGPAVFAAVGGFCTGYAPVMAAGGNFHPRVFRPGVG